MAQRSKQQSRARAGRRALEEKAQAEGWTDEQIIKYGDEWKGGDEEQPDN